MQKCLYQNSGLNYFMLDNVNWKLIYVRWIKFEKYFPQNENHDSLEAQANVVARLPFRNLNCEIEVVLSFF